MFLITFNVDYPRDRDWHLNLLFSTPIVLSTKFLRSMFFIKFLTKSDSILCHKTISNSISIYAYIHFIITN